MLEEQEMKRRSDFTIEELLKDFNAHRIEVAAHMDEFKRHTDDEEKKWITIITLAEKNEWSIANLSAAVDKHREQTEELILLNTRLKSVRWFASGVSAMLGWVTALAVGLGAAYSGLFDKT